MAHHRHVGSMAALTPVPVVLHNHNLILQIIELNPQTESVVFRVMEMSRRVLYIYRESNPFDDLVTRGINRGHVTRYMLHDCCELFYSLFGEYMSVKD